MTADDLDALRKGGKPALAACLKTIASRPGSVPVISLLDAAHGAPRGRVIGLTGPPGAGKSTLAALMIRCWREEGLRVAVIAVDPSSTASGGALLGDRLRMGGDPEDDDLFIRSQAAGDMLGGLAATTFPAVTLMRALYDRVLIETVGVGQSETGLRDIADTVLMLIQPESGDMLQFLKAGIMEAPDIFVIGKADIGAAALKAREEVEAALNLQARADDWLPPALLHSALPPFPHWPALHAALRSHWVWFSAGDRLAARRRGQSKAALRAIIRDRRGRDGLAELGPAIDDEAAARPFAALKALLQS